MKTYLECIPCFLNQALRVMDFEKIDSCTKQKIFKKILIKLSELDLKNNPPEFALFIYSIINEEVGNSNFYEKIKKNDTNIALKLIPEINKISKKYDDYLNFLIKIAIAGNIMDFAANPKYNALETIIRSVNSKFAINDYVILKKEILTAKTIAYIVDNAGELVFDKLLIEEISRISNAQITIFVRSEPIINDVTEKDAKNLKIDKLPNVKIKKIETIFPFINKSKNLEKEFNAFDLIISKGQANYECLSEFKGNVYFLLVVKCEVIAKDIGVKKSDFVLFKKNS